MLTMQLAEIRVFWLYKLGYEMKWSVNAFLCVDVLCVILLVDLVNIDYCTSWKVRVTSSQRLTIQLVETKVLVLHVGLEIKWSIEIYLGINDGLSVIKLVDMLNIAYCAPRLGTFTIFQQVRLTDRQSQTCTLSRKSTLVCIITFVLTS